MELISIILFVVGILVIYLLIRLVKISRKRKMIYETFGVKMENLDINSREFGFIKLFNFLSKNADRGKMDSKLFSFRVLEIIKNFFSSDDAEIYKKYNLNIYVYYEILLYLYVVAEKHMKTLCDNGNIEQTQVVSLTNYLDMIKLSFGALLGEEYVQRKYIERFCQFNGITQLEPVTDLRYLVGVKDHFSEVLLRNIEQIGIQHDRGDKAELSAEGHMSLTLNIIAFEQIIENKYIPMINYTLAKLDPNFAQ